MTRAGLAQHLLPTVMGSLPVHIDDSPAFKGPLSWFTAAVERRGLAEKVVYVERGQTVVL